MTGIKDLKINLEQRILGAEKVVIVPHKRIDFDAIGSGIGLSLIAQKLRKPSVIVVDEDIPKEERGLKLIFEDAKKDFNIINRDRYLQMQSGGDLYLLTDVNKSYLISLRELLTKDRTVIIDHHDEDKDTVDADLKFINTTASSASEIVSKLLCLFKIKPTPEIAKYLLAGIYLDTNKLTKNASADTMKVVAKLLESGANLNRVTDLFMQDFVSDRRVQDLINKAKILEYKIALVCAEEGIQYTPEDLAKASDYLLNYGVDASFAIGNIGSGLISISARSKERIHVGEVMKSLGGGGNQYSAAAKLTDTTIEEVGKQLMKTMQVPYYIG